MAITSLSQRTTNSTQNQAAVEYIAGAGNRPKVLEIGLINTTVTTTVFGLGRPAVAGITPVGVTFLPEDPGEPTPLTRGALSWATSPVPPIICFRRWFSTASIGYGIVWTFPRGLLIEPTATLVIANLTTAATLDVWCVVDE